MSHVKEELERIKREAERIEPFVVEEKEDQILFVEVIGEAGVGKTHLACTFPPKVALIMTSRESKDAYATARKFVKKGLVKPYVINSYMELLAAINKSLEDEEVKTIAIDSSADIGLIVKEEFDKREVSLVSSAGGKVAPFGWANVYREFDTGLFARCIQKGKNLVLTSKVEEDGKVKGFKGAEYAVMIRLILHLGRYDEEQMKYVETDKIYGEVIKNQFKHPTRQREWIEEPTYEKILSLTEEDEL